MNELFFCKHVPILLMETDSAQYEAPHSPKPLNSAVHLFKALKLDVFIHSVNAAGCSAFNPCEHRMSVTFMMLLELYLSMTSLVN